MKTLLVIDDDKDVVDLVRFIADREGYQILTAEDGQEGLNLALSKKPNLIIMDIMMPELDGHSASQELSRQEDTKNIPVIILTAKSNMREAFEALPNVVAYIEKPFEPKQVTEAIRQHIPN